MEESLHLTLKEETQTQTKLLFGNCGSFAPSEEQMFLGGWERHWGIQAGSQAGRAPHDGGVEKNFVKILSGPGLDKRHRQTGLFTC